MMGLSINHVTDDMRDQALAKAKETIQKLEAMRVELGLDPDMLPFVEHVYGSHLMSLAHDAMHVRQKARRARLREKFKNYQDDGISPFPGSGSYVGRAPFGLDPNMLDDDDDDEQPGCGC